MAVRKLRPEVYTLNVDIEHFVATRGDLVKVQNDVILVGITSGRVKGLVTSGSDITGIEIDEAVFPPVGETCAVRLRLADGSFVVQDVINTPGGRNDDADVLRSGGRGRGGRSIRVRLVRERDGGLPDNGRFPR
jgi:hypothetical protein